MSHLLILENIRSAYNTGVMLRTCDALWWQAVLSWFTPDPETDEKVHKTALGAQASVVVWSFRNPTEAIQRARVQWYTLIAAEKNMKSAALPQFTKTPKAKYAVFMGNENTGVLAETLNVVDHILHIPMLGMKESLNVAEAAAIFMWELNQI